MITLKTNHGDIVIELDKENAPKTSENFIQYVRDGHFEGTIFHRVIENFMIQGGGFGPGMVEKPTRAPIENEAAGGPSNLKGTIAMARTSDPHSATAQFFINVGDNKFLDHPGQDGWGYCVFGRITAGMDVVDTIKGVETTNRDGHGDVPVEDIVIEKAVIDE
jgi:peptidyl-prolyl cis-trans isomerase B (cyclophilin B)